MPLDQGPMNPYVRDRGNPPMNIGGTAAPGMPGGGDSMSQTLMLMKMMQEMNKEGGMFKGMKPQGGGGGMGTGGMGGGGISEFYAP